MKAVAAAITVLLAGAAGRARADEPATGQRIAMYGKPAVVRVWGAYRTRFRFDGKDWETGVGGTGSGFFIDPDGYLATNAHVVQQIHVSEEQTRKALLERAVDQILDKYKDDFARMSRDQAVAVLQQIQLGAIEKVAVVVLPNGDRLPYEIVAYGAPVNEGKDVAIIKVDTHDAPTLEIGDATGVQLQDPVFVIGYPGAADLEDFGVLDARSLLEATITDGKVSALKHTAGGDQVIQTTAPIGHGNSGGPALDAQGRVIGLATFGDLSTQGFNFLVTSTTLRELAGKTKARNRLSKTDKLYREALKLLWDRRCSAAI
ncbi:MAG TPA: serine protease, partial [Kofleriaceae bacterium]|nr:serine protease [Kofleriaceae bacterium]